MDVTNASSTLTLGNDLTVHRLGFGAMRITGKGIWGPPNDRTNALAVLRRAVQIGVEFIDTADAYGPNVSEELIAEALHPYPKGLVVATKGGLTRSGPDRWDRDGRPAHLRAACEGSLKRLRVDRIEVYQLHAPDPRVPFEESVGALAQLRTEGKIRHVGLSNVSVELLQRARKIVPIVSVQNRYSLFDRESESVLAECQKEGIAFIPWYPLAAGDLGRLGERMRAVATAHGATLAQIALAWLLQKSPVMLPIPGTSSVVHLEENVAASKIQITPDEMRSLTG
jgi:aryl-alcohol dehydrogenase-like predicted oxidoreductase